MTLMGDLKENSALSRRKNDQSNQQLLQHPYEYVRYHIQRGFGYQKSIDLMEAELLYKNIKQMSIAVLGVGVLLLWLIFPNTKRKRQMEAFLTKDYAHRGLHGKGTPENSLKAFQRACEHGYGIELDVQLSRDGVPVVFHDRTLQRMCQADGEIKDYTLEDLKFSLLGSKEPIPTFRQVLDLVDGRVPLLIELKMTEERERLVNAVLLELESYQGEYLVESFDPRILQVLRKKDPTILIGQLSGGLFSQKKSLSRFMADRLLWNVYSRPDFIAYQHHRGRVLLMFYSWLFEIPVFSYTIKNQRDYHLKRWFTSHIFEGFLPVSEGRVRAKRKSPKLLPARTSLGK